MKLAIEIDDELYKALLNGYEEPYSRMFSDTVKNGTPLEKHDEEIIKETVESIWGKPPYTEVLDSIKAEIEQNAYPIVHGVNNHELGMTLYGILQVIDKYKAKSEDKE